MKQRPRFAAWVATACAPLALTVALAQDAPDVRPMSNDEVTELVQALGQPGADAALLQSAYEEFVRQHDSFRVDGARQLAEAMYAQQPATWSAFCLEGIARRGGDPARAEAVLSEQLERVTAGQERIDLLERRAIARGGAGDLVGSRRDLARALASGGTDACQILGLQALETQQLDEARELFRILLERADRAADGTEPPAWALRGWALSLTPRERP